MQLRPLLPRLGHESRDPGALPEGDPVLPFHQQLPFRRDAHALLALVVLLPLRPQPEDEEVEDQAERPGGVQHVPPALLVEHVEEARLLHPQDARGGVALDLVEVPDARHARDVGAPGVGRGAAPHAPEQQVGPVHGDVRAQADPQHQRHLQLQLHVVHGGEALPAARQEDGALHEALRARGARGLAKEPEVRGQVAAAVPAIHGRVVEVAPLAVRTPELAAVVEGVPAPGELQQLQRVLQAGRAAPQDAEQQAGAQGVERHEQGVPPGAGRGCGAG
mmetsp:Transcript_57195/g.177771  ORF Transcript_57195/g.177771 Transcript_57195/m.177771 type:complete len:277 (+) Transcript_57195:475-1305(+)